MLSRWRGLGGNDRWHRLGWRNNHRGLDDDRVRGRRRWWRDWNMGGLRGDLVGRPHRWRSATARGRHRVRMLLNGRPSVVVVGVRKVLASVGVGLIEWRHRIVATGVVVLRCEVGWAVELRLTRAMGLEGDAGMAVSVARDMAVSIPGGVAVSIPRGVAVSIRRRVAVSIRGGIAVSIASGLVAIQRGRHAADKTGRIAVSKAGGVVSVGIPRGMTVKIAMGGGHRSSPTGSATRAHVRRRCRCRRSLHRLPSRQMTAIHHAGLGCEDTQ